jgi:hypothetical protein
LISNIHKVDIWPNFQIFGRKPNIFEFVQKPNIWLNIWKIKITLIKPTTVLTINSIQCDQKMMLLIIVAAHFLHNYHDSSILVAAARFPPLSGRLMQVKGSVSVPLVDTSEKNNGFQQRLNALSRNDKLQRSLQLNAQSKRIGIPDVIRSIFRRKRRAYVQSKRCTNIPRGGSKYSTCRNALKPKSKNIRMYLACLGVVLAWITTGTIFYSKYNNWPLPQSFFYAVDAGMSIGFCTDVAETKIGSRAFTIIFILLGASCVGGALALFIKDIMEGVADLRHDTFDQLLAAHAVQRIDSERKGELTYPQFRTIVEEWTNETISDETFKKLCQRFDASNRGTVPSELFVKRCHEMDTLLYTAGPLYSKKFLVRKAAQTWEFLKESFNGTHRIFTIFLIWIFTGIW